MTGHILANLAALGLILLGAAGHAGGMLEAGYAFFAVFAGLVLYTGSQFSWRAGAELGHALRSLLAEPASYPAAGPGQIAYLGACALGLAALVTFAAA